MSEENLKIPQLNFQELDLSVQIAKEKKNFLFIANSYIKNFYNNISIFFIHHPLFGYSFRRIFYGLLTLLLSVIIVFLLVNSVTSPLQYLPENWQKIFPGKTVNDPLVQRFIEDRMKMFGVYGDPITRLLTYIKNIIPFIPKHVLKSQQILSDPTFWNQVITDVNSTQYINYITNMANTLGIEKVNFELLGVRLDEIKLELIYETRWIYFGLVSSPLLGVPGSTEISDLFTAALPVSFAIGGVAILCSYIIGIPLGIEAAMRKGKKADVFINGISTLIIAIPMLIIVIAIYLLSVQGFGNSGLFTSNSIWPKIWPVVAIILVFTPSTIILTRRFVIDEMNADYTRFALSKGLSKKRVFYLHIFRNAGIRIIRQLPLDLALALFGASFVVEKQWGIPGVSQIPVSAISGSKDSLVIMAFVTLAAFIKIFSNLLADLITIGLDPRVDLVKKN